MRVSSLLLALGLVGCARPTEAPSEPSRSTSAAVAVVSPAPSLAPPNSPSPPPLGRAPFALVELFTSEGCSSCPPADVVASDLQTTRTPGVYVLAFHVDYWDQLGWPDPWASAESTARQQAYSAARGDRGVYTPQLVVSGEDAFVGSDRSRAGAAVRSSLSHPATVDVAVRSSSSGSALSVSWRVAGAPPGSQLHVALTEDGLVSRVTRGENAGRTLRHDGVVRRFHTRTVAGDESGTMTLEVPADEKLDASRIVAFVSDGPAGRVLGASGCGAL